VEGDLGLWIPPIAAYRAGVARPAAAIEVRSAFDARDISANLINLD